VIQTSEPTLRPAPNITPEIAKIDDRLAWCSQRSVRKRGGMIAERADAGG
jgi:hypothetical protein